MKIDVDSGLCEANGICMGILTKVFDLGDDDLPTVLTPTIDKDREQLVIEAIRQRPRQAIFVVD